MNTMRPLRAFLRLGTGLLLVIALVAAGCGAGGGSGEEADGTTAPGSDPESADPGGGAPIGRAPEGVIGSPIKMPAIELNGRPPSAVKEFVEPLIEEACGGDVCVTLSYVDQDDVPIDESEPRFSAEGPGDPEICGFSPEQSGTETDRQVDRGDVVTLVFECITSDVDPDDGGGDGAGTDGVDPSSDEVETEAPST